MPENNAPLITTRIEERDTGRVAYVTVTNPGQRNALGRRGKEELIAKAVIRCSSRHSI